jgi:hypothetical protein
MGSAFPLCFGGVFVLIGAGLLVIAGRNERKAEQSKVWPTAQGKITASTLTESTSTDNDGMTNTTYKPSVQYTYDVGGKSYTADRLSRGLAMAYDLGTARRIIERYPVGAAIAVHYDPAAPAEAALETNAGGGTALRIVGVVMLVAGVLCAAAAAIPPLLSRFLNGFTGF